MPKGQLSQTSTAILEKPTVDPSATVEQVELQNHGMPLFSNQKLGQVVFWPIVEGDHPARFDPFLKSSKFRGFVFFQ